MAAQDGSDGNITEAEGTVQLLTEAINTRDKDEASKHLNRLLELNLPVTIKLIPEAYSQESIRLRVWVGDAESDAQIPITVMVPVYMTISELKEKINRNYGFHPSLQRWVIGKRLAQDTQTLFQYGIRKHDDTAFLFIRSAMAGHLSREQERKEKEDQRIDVMLEKIEKPPPAELRARGTARPPVAPKAELGWSCPECTFINKPTRPGCEMCSSPRPDNYAIPDLYRPDEDESRRLQDEELAALQYEQSLMEEEERNFLERERNYQELLETDSHGLVGNTDELECAICFSSILPGEGAVLRECLHSFCRDCLKGTIQNCTDAEVTCPYGDNAYACNCKLQDREIKSLLSQEDYQKFLELRLNIAESRSENSFHCKTVDCVGWCVFEDDVNEFICDICQETNCLLCKAIHKGMNCKEYQDDLRIRAQNDEAARQTTAMLDQLLTNGEAMTCPKCKVIIQKKDGCDWIWCMMCKTEICWVTKQARWGPQGQGDTSGGCRCRVNGVLCHPKCQNCH